MKNFQNFALETPRHWLASRLDERRQKNKMYSLRAFSRDLGIPAGLLSEVLSGKRSLTAKLAERISLRLDLSHDEKRALFDSITSDLFKRTVSKLLTSTLPNPHITDKMAENTISLKKTLRVRPSVLRNNAALIESLFGILESVLSSDDNSYGEKATNYTIRLELTPE
jgi:transcriptional regulator with XRE-family HTH domain